MLRVQVMLAQISKPGLAGFSGLYADDMFAISSNRLGPIKRKFKSCLKKREAEQASSLAVLQKVIVLAFRVSD